jgi:microsomal epoxide hydrolase
MTVAQEQAVPFTIDVPEAQLSDLRARLQRTRLPDQLEGVGWEMGAELGFMQRLQRYWLEEYDWREAEQQLNKFDQYLMQVADLQMHFIHQKSRRSDALPLLLVHGWPGSVSEFQHIIEALTAPDDPQMPAFHVIAPSLPGFGFSEAPRQRGTNPEAIALLLAQLMQQLGYSHYVAAGGDWGAIINRHLANHFPERLLGLHSNMLLAAPPSDPERRDAISEQERTWLNSRRQFMENERAYQQLQGSKPQSLGYGLQDSPLGLAAWISEKFHGWSDLDEGVELGQRITMSDLLTNISIYWFTGTINSSLRIYYENRTTPPSKAMGFINVPTAAAMFPADLYFTPRAWAEESYAITQWTLMPRGGHFAAMEEPALYLQDLRRFVQGL